MLYWLFDDLLFVFTCLLVYLVKKKTVTTLQVFDAFQYSNLEVCWLQCNLCTQVNNLEHLLNEIFLSSLFISLWLSKTNHQTLLNNIIFIDWMIIFTFKNWLKILFLIVRSLFVRVLTFSINTIIWYIIWARMFNTMSTRAFIFILFFFFYLFSNFI